jgi:hypothetical protein
MSVRVEAHGKLLISNDNTSSPVDIVFASGDKSLIDATTYNEATSKVLPLAPNAVNVQVNLDAIVSVAMLFVITSSALVSVTLVPTGKVLANCSALKLIPNMPLVIGSDIAAVYLSNADTGNTAQVKIGAAGN